MDVLQVVMRIGHDISGDQYMKNKASLAILLVTLGSGCNTLNIGWMTVMEKEGCCRLLEEIEELLAHQSQLT